MTEAIRTIESYRATGDGTAIRLGSVYTTYASAQAHFPNLPNLPAYPWQDWTLDTAAMWEAANDPDVKIVNFRPDGRYAQSHEIIIRYPQSWLTETAISQEEFEIPDNINSLGDQLLSARGAIIYTVNDGVSFQTIKTRRYYTDSSTISDNPMSAQLNIQAQFFRTNLIFICTPFPFNPAIPNSPTSAEVTASYGHNWDIGIFVGCRRGINLSDATVIGYHRRYGVLVDVSRLSDIVSPFLGYELKGWDGVSYKYDKFFGVDGLLFNNLTVKGARVAFAILGSKPKPEDKFRAYGKEYEFSYSITFSDTTSVSHGDSITVAEQKFVFVSTNTNTPNLYTSGWLVVIGSTIDETVTNFLNALNACSSKKLSKNSYFSCSMFLLSATNPKKILCWPDANVLNAFSLFSSIGLNKFQITTSNTSVVAIIQDNVNKQPDQALYYIDAANPNVTDGRGAIGASDISGSNFKFISNKHPSHFRMQDIDASLNHIIEPDTAEAAIHIDGLAANSFSRIWGIRFANGRCVSNGAFINRLDRCARVSFIDCHTEPDPKAKTTTGISTSVDYGSYTNTPNTFALSIEGANSAPDFKYLSLHDEGSSLLRSATGYNSIGGSKNIKEILDSVYFLRRISNISSIYKNSLATSGIVSALLEIPPNSLKEGDIISTCFTGILKNSENSTNIKNIASLIRIKLGSNAVVSKCSLIQNLPIAAEENNILEYQWKGIVVFDGLNSAIASTFELKFKGEIVKSGQDYFTFNIDQPIELAPGIKFSHASEDNSLRVVRAETIVK